MPTLADSPVPKPTALRGFLLFVAVLLAALVVRQDMPSGSLFTRLGGVGAADPELQRAAERGAMCSSSNPTGVGLRGEYFSKEKLQGAPLLVRTDAGIDLDPGLDWQTASDASQRPRSIRWTGWVKPPVTGRYQFHMKGGDAIITVAREVFTQAGGPAEGVELHAGRYAPVSIEMNVLPAGTDRVRFEWTTPYGARFVIPRALLFMPTESAIAKKP